MKQSRIYVETSVISYLSNRPSRDAVTLLITADALPSIARLDALHIATCCVHGIPLLLTWNFTHIANPHKTRLVEQVCRDYGFEPALLVSPDQLLQTDSNIEQE